MEKMLMCRVCLAENVRMFKVVNKNLCELYEKLTDIPFVTEDSRPMLACYFCCTKLKQCCQFQRKCLQAEELFARMMNGDYVANTLINQDHPVFCNGFIQSPIEHISIVNECHTENIKKELLADFESLDDIIEPKEEHENDELENQENSFSENVPAQHSEPDSEDDKPLVKFKIEVEEHEVSRNKSKLEDVISKERKKNEQLDTKVIKCENSDKVTDDDFINRHQRLCGREEPFKCDICQRVFRKKSSLTKHIHHIHAGGKPYKCGICQRCFSIKSHLTSHIRTHTVEKPYKCEVCQRCFNGKFNLIRHIRQHSGEKPFECEVCQRCFTDNSNLKRHIRLHTGEKPFKCDFCLRCFTEKAHLTYHNRTHTGGKPKKYVKGHLTKLTSEHAGEEPYKCDVCQRSFNLKWHFTKHIKLHAGNPFKCDICQRSFNLKGNLTKHIRLHSGEKLFQCDICQRCFNYKSSLISHIRVHTGEKPYKCDVCHTCFSQTSGLKRHIRIHTGEKPYKCEVCQRVFKEKRSLTKHTCIETGEERLFEKS